MGSPCRTHGLHPGDFDDQVSVPVDAAYGHRPAEGAVRSLIVAQERELSRIARELHDDVCQRLVMLSLRIDKVTNAWTTGQTQIGEQLEQIRQYCSVLVGDVQALSHELHPSILDHLGLVPAIRSLCREIKQQKNITVNFVAENVPDPLPRDVALCLFRVVQEAIHNSLKYSCDDRYQVQLDGIDDGIRLEIRDRGVGFDVSRATNRGSLGLVSMRERVQLLNGTIRIDSKRNEGTRILVMLPLADQTQSSFTTSN